MVYAVPITPFRIERPNYSLKEFGQGMDALGERFRRDEEDQRQLAIGATLNGGDLRGGSSKAFELGDLKTGLALRNAATSEDVRNEQLADRRAAMAQRSQADDQGRAEKAKKYVGNMLTTLNPNDPKFSDDWAMHIRRLRSAGHNVGPEYDDPRTGYQMALAEVTDLKSRSSMENQRRDDGLRGQEIAIRQGEADSRALQRNRRDVLDAVRVMQTAATPEQWQQAQPIIQATFGRPVPYNERNVVLAQAQSTARAGDDFEPTERDRALGTTRQQKIEQAQNDELVKTYGPAKRGFMWSRDKNGQPVQKQVATPQKPVDPGMRNMGRQFIGHLDAAEKELLSSSLPGRAVAGYLDYGKTGEALRDYEQAALGAVYTLSGKQTTNKEMERFLNLYKPSAGDSADRIKWKTNRIRSFLKGLVSGMEDGMSRGLTREEAYQEAEGRAMFGAGDRSSAPSGGGKKGNDLRGLSDQELLEMLNQ